MNSSIVAFPKELLGKVAVRDNLFKAWEDISRYSRPLSHGISEQTIQDFRANRKEQLEDIRKRLIGGSYNFSPVRAVTIDKKGGKKRPLRIADIRDRVVQRAMARVLEKHFTKSFNLDNPASHAYLKNKGVQTAIKRMLLFHQNNCRYIFEADIVNFFDTVNTERLLNDMIFPNLSDTTINSLLYDALHLEIGNKENLPEEDWDLFPDSSTGLPQGGYLSPLFSNIYLSVFDQKMLNAQFRLIRYADDFIVMCESISEAENAFKLAREILEDDLGLSLHTRDDNNKKARTRVIRVSQKSISFLGIQFNGSRIWPSSEKRQVLTKKIAQLGKSRNVQTLLASMSNLLEGWAAAYSFTDLNWKYTNKIDQEVNKILWNSLSRLGWKLQPKYLNQDQRNNSGVRPISDHVNKYRRDMHDRELYNKYWGI